MSVVENNHIISLLYVVKDKHSGEILDSNNDRENPFEFLVGGAQVVSGLEKAIIGSRVGDKLDIEVLPHEAYGERNNSLLQELPKEQFSGIDLVKGMTLFGQGDNGQTVQVIVDEIGEDSIIIDYNHPLAGKTLLFSVEILDTREATQDEILEASLSCGCSSGGSHSHGGCCGGNGDCGCH